MVIYKYTLPDIVNTVHTVRIPYDATILDYQIQDSGSGAGSQHVIWALVDEQITGGIDYRFILTWTGWANVVNKEDIYIGTAQRKDGLVYHLFQRP